MINSSVCNLNYALSPINKNSKLKKINSKINPITKIPKELSISKINKIKNSKKITHLLNYLQNFIQSKNNFIKSGNKAIFLS